LRTRGDRLMSGLFGSGHVNCIHGSDQALLIVYLVPEKALFNRF
jgi:hypothetical protein